MKRYQNAFLKRINDTFKEWMIKEAISNQDLHQLLSTIKRKGASLGLDSLSVTAEEILKLVNVNENRIWYLDEWNNVTDQLINQIDQQMMFMEQSDEEDTYTHVVEQSEKENKLILLVEDHAEMLNDLKASLEAENFTVLVAVNAEKALTIFFDQHPDCVILDVHLKDESGLKLAKMIMEYSKKYLVPILLISSIDNKETVIQAYDAGVNDFIKKPFDKEIFIALLKNRLRQRSHLRSAVLLDELTGAFNRKFFNMEFQRQVSDLGRSSSFFTIAILDIDHFKQVNDSYGHHVGDLVLKRLAQVFMHGKRHADYFIRYGGEEFLLMLPHTNADEAKQVLDRIKKEFSSIKFEADDESFGCTFSAGILEVNDQNTHMEDCLKRADEALYDAKEDGRDRIYIYNEPIKGIIRKQRYIRIGIIDDEPVVQEMLTDHLKKLQFSGFELEIKSFSEGEDFFGSEWYHQKGKFVILYDGMMPRMDGLEFLQRLRAEKRAQDFVIIMLTERNSNKEVVNALELGLDDYLIKPFSLTELEARVKRLTTSMLV